MKKVIMCGLAVLLPAALALATPTISVVSADIDVDGGPQGITISVTGGDAVQGLNLNLQIGDGFGASPIITGASMFDAGMVFAASNTGDSGAGVLTPQIWSSVTTTATGTVPATGILAEIMVDPTGAALGDYPLSLTSLNGATDFAGLPTNLVDGVITVTPEPTSLLLLGLGGLFLRRRRA